MITLHLGQPKTGTSILQSALFLLSEESDSFVYPKAFQGPGRGHHTLVHKLRQPGGFEEIRPELKALLTREAARDIVFSTEEFCNLIGPRHQPVLRRLAGVCARHAEVQGVLYLRRYDDFFNSMMLQSMRYGDFHGSPEDYVFMRLSDIYVFFASLKKLREEAAMTLRLVPYGPGFDILQNFQEVCPATRGLDAVGPLPKTEKFSWKQQVFIAQSPDILGTRLSRAQMEKMIIAMREAGTGLEGDLTNYCIIPPELDQVVNDAALIAARTQGITEYSEAFSAPGDKEKHYVPFDRSILTKQDIAILSEMAGVTPLAP
ncbi:hypothetical protein [Pacificoceanicola onchidii]|uniref:hypothetical protein n=1 Tax=Pacificoceanicola onchidii TaxID=2562685 RepID=UPI0010A5BF5F|nr:hypothetical protein [Pacificoceanicola onchidii]